MSGPASESVVPAAAPAVEAAVDAANDIATQLSDAAVAAAEPAKPVDIQKEAAAAFDKGVEEVTAKPAGSETTQPEKDARGYTRDPATGQFTVAPVAAPGATGPAGATGAADPAAEKDPVKIAAAKVETEIQTLGLKEKAAERFRELSKRPTPEAFAQAKSDADRGAQWEDIILQSTVKPDQLQRLLGYGQAVNSGDPAAMRVAYDAMQKEMAWLGKTLGLEAPGVDPLEAHADLKQQVAEGDITRAAALELASHRASARLGTEHQQQTQRQQQQEQQLASDRETARVGLNTLGQSLQAADPAHFDAKIAMLAPTIGIIRESLPPSRWVAVLHAAYLKCPTPAAAPAPAAVPRPGHVPLRPSGAPSASHTRQPKNDLEAFEIGLASVSQ